MNKNIATGTKTLLILLLTFGTAAFADSAVPAQQRPGEQGLFKTAQMSKASTPLVRVLSEYRAHAKQGRPTVFVPGNRFLPYSAGRVLVDARATTNGAVLLDDLQQLGLTNGAHYGELVSGLLPVAVIDQAVELASLRSISAAIAPITNVEPTISQGDTALGAAAARSFYGVDGTGVTVGVLSDSFDMLGGAEADIASGDLPAAGVQVLGGEHPYCGIYVFCIDEGRAMAQIIYDMAPGVDILFHTGLASKADYANGIIALAAAGADVIVDDLLYLNEPMFQDGIVAQAVDTVTAGGVAYYSAAGNAGDNSYEAAFADSGVIFCIEFFYPIGDCDPIYERVGRMHDFDPGPGVDLYQSITVPIEGVLTVALQWDEPFGGAGPRNDHDIVLLDETGGIFFEISANDNVRTGEGWEVLQFYNATYLGYGTSFNLIITYDDVDSRDPPATLLKTVVFGSGNTLNEFQTNSSTLFGHANAAGAEAVGAAFFENTPAYDVVPPLLEPYSSRGGTPILFSSNGASLESPEVRSKPEITAVDGVNTTFFFNDSYGNDGVDDFFGTSAAAPHAAGIAALMLQARSGSTPQQINSALQGSAIDMNAPGFDYDSGYGLIQADAAIAALLASGGNNPPAADFTFSIASFDVTFTDTSTDLDGNITDWNWDFGDGNNDNVQNPLHMYTAGGTYTVALTVTDDDGGMDSTSQQVIVGTVGGGNEPPVASFTYTCSAWVCDFDASASSPAVSIVEYAWAFGDGTSSTSASPIASNTYLANGNIGVTLVVTDAAGASDTAIAVFRVKKKGNTSGSSDGGDDGTGGTEKGRKKCTDSLDNDGDGLIDAADPDCK